MYVRGEISGKRDVGGTSMQHEAKLGEEKGNNQARRRSIFAGTCFAPPTSLELVQGKGGGGGGVLRGSLRVCCSPDTFLFYSPPPPTSIGRREVRWGRRSEVEEGGANARITPLPFFLGRGTGRSSSRLIRERERSPPSSPSTNDSRRKPG